MAITKIPFNHEGGVLKVKIEFHGLIAASYTYQLWDKNSNHIVFEKKGNNQNPEDDIYELPSPARNNEGRLIDIHSTLVGLYDNDNEGKYKIEITVIQDDQIINKNIQPLSPKIIGNNVVAHQYFGLLV